MNAAARLITNTQKFDRYIMVSRHVHAVPRPSLVGRQCHCLQVRTRNGTWLSVRAAPTSFYISRTTSPAFCWSRPSWRSSCQTCHYGKQSFAYAGPSAWSSLPDDLRDTSFSLSVFAARRYAHKRGLCCRPVSVRPSVCLSRWCIVSNTAEDIVKLLGRSGSSVILIFWLSAPVPNSKGTPSTGAQNTRGEKICDFRMKSPSISETVRHRPMER